MQAHSALYEVLPMVLEEAKGKPVIAAGGIGNGAAIYKALASGAGAALLGTRFGATLESNTHDEYKKAILAAHPADTALTLCFQDRFPQSHRALRNSTFLTWEAAGSPQPGNRPGEGDHVFTRDGIKILRYAVTVPLVGSTGRLNEAAMYAGMGVGDVKDVSSAVGLVARLWSETQAAHHSAR